jgi:hypothetical protein
MSDTSSRDQAALRFDATKARPTARQRNPGELLFEFLLRGDRWRGELRTEHGYDVQFFCGDPFVHGHRFESRVVAEEWASGTREVLEKSA